MIALCAVGCAKKTAAPPKIEPEKKPTAESTTIESGAGSTELFSADGNHRRLWKVEWEGLSISGSGAQGSKGEISLDPDEGMMKGVTGEVDDEKGVASTFRSDAAFANKKEQVLALQGSVLVRSKRMVGTLRCDRLEWLPKRKRYHAVGNVTATSSVGTVGPLPELWATPDLKKVSTP